MIDSIQTFGDSFLYGSDLSDCLNNKIQDHTAYSRKTWPALIAKDLNLKYDCHARSGRGNQSIAVTIFQLAKQNSLNIINWTWIDRFDYNFTQKYWAETILPGDQNEISKLYYKHIHRELDDKIRNQNIVYSVIQYLKTNNMPFIMTYMDNLLIDNTIIGLEHIASEIIDNLQTFSDNQTFLEWSRANNYPESQGWHPLEQAHKEAANHWQPIYEKEISKHITTK